jgi:hypothetical protein
MIRMRGAGGGRDALQEQTIGNGHFTRPSWLGWIPLCNTLRFHWRRLKERRGSGAKARWRPNTPSRPPASTGSRPMTHGCASRCVCETSPQSIRNRSIKTSLVQIFSISGIVSRSLYPEHECDRDETLPLERRLASTGSRLMTPGYAYRWVGVGVGGWGVGVGVLG